jgi:hypothetical protein
MATPGTRRSTSIPLGTLVPIPDYKNETPQRAVRLRLASRRVPPLPPPLPPEERTVGQLVAESMRLYGRRFLPSLLLGIGPAALNALVRVVDEATLVLLPTLGGVVLSACFVGACLIAGERRGNPWSALAAGALVFLPFPFLAAIFVLPGLVWLAFVGLVVPVLVYERIGLRDAFLRATRLARADFVHALGSLATLAIVVFLTQSVLFFLLRGTGEQTQDIASFLASLVVSPLLFLGAALLYFDQAARENAKRVPRR